MTDGQGSQLPESWVDFGRQLDSFFSRSGEILKSRQYNVVMGFTRGGAILANILSSELSDRFPDIYRGPAYGAIRTIPNGIHKKGYDRADFVMGASCAEEDLQDLGSLMSELRDFRTSYSLDVVRALLVDDNLTGSTRMRLFMERLTQLGFIDLDLLAYTRNPVFLLPKIDFYIRDEPIATNQYLVMPWHEVHPPRGMSTLTGSIGFIIKLSNPLGTTAEQLRDELLQLLPRSKQPNRLEVRRNTLFFKRGETYLEMRVESDTTLIKVVAYMFYPPKDCLGGEIGFDDISICRLGSPMLSAEACRLCSALNCLRDVFDILLRNFDTEFLGYHVLDDTIDLEDTGLRPSMLPTLFETIRKSPWDPRFMRLDEFGRLSQQEQLQVRDRVEELHGDWIREELEHRRVAWIVTMGSEIMLESKDLFNTPTLEDVMPLARQKDAVPFLFMKLGPIEELRATWSDCGTVDHFKDWYPTIHIRISDASRPGHDPLEFIADFDTGNPYIHLDGDILWDRGITREFNFFNRQRDSFHEMEYTYYPSHVFLEIMEEDRPVVEMTTQVNCVLDWKRSPFVIANPNRTAFVGRQVFKFSDFSAILDGTNHVTRAE